MAVRFLKSLMPWSLWAAFVAVATFAALGALFPQPILQPVSFNHKKHADFGCDFCHEGVETRARASIPQITLCMDCHDEAPVKAPAEVEAWNRAVEAKRIEWKMLTRMDGHVYFSHQRHVGMAKIECKTCHGDMAERTTPPPRALKLVTMDFCMDCHAAQKVSNDCARCHK